MKRIETLSRQCQKSFANRYWGAHKFKEYFPWNLKQVTHNNFITNGNDNIDKVDTMVLFTGNYFLSDIYVYSLPYTHNIETLASMVAIRVKQPIITRVHTSDDDLINFLLYNDYCICEQRDIDYLHQLIIGDKYTLKKCARLL